jgi:hypothetical protein
VLKLEGYCFILVILIQKHYGKLFAYNDHILCGVFKVCDFLEDRICPYQRELFGEDLLDIAYLAAILVVLLDDEKGFFWKYGYPL